MTEEKKKGFVIYKLSDLEEKVYYRTENLTPIIRISEIQVLMGNKIKIPVYPERSEYYMEGRLLPETLIYALENHFKKKFSEGLMFIEVGKKIGKIFHSFNELQKDITYISPGEDVLLNISSKDKYVLFKFKENKKTPELLMTPLSSTTPVYSRNKVSGKGDIKTQKITKNLFGVKFATPNLEGEISNVFEEELNSNHTQTIEMIYEENSLMMDNTDMVFDGPPPPPPLPPPPPPLSMGESTAKKKKMRTFHWSAIPLDKVEETFWGQTKNDSPLKHMVNVDENEVETLFSLSPTQKVLASKTKSSNVLTLIDFKRANNAGIILSRFSKDPWEIKSYVNKLESEQFSQEEIKILLGLFPLTTKESFDIERFINKNNDQLDEVLKTMNKVEQFYVLMSTIPRIESKLQSFSTFIVFEHNLEELKKNCSVITKACSELKDSKQFKSILKIIFKVGSILNRGSSLSAVGFRLNTLMQLNETKSKNGVTLLHYITNLIYKQDPNLLLFQTTLPSVETASKISIEALEEEYTLLKNQISSFSLEFQTCLEETSEESLAFVNKYSSFLDNSKLLLEQFSVEYREMIDSFVEIATYYGEKELSQTKSSRGFFSILVRFAYSLAKESDNIQNKQIRLQRRLSLSTNILKKKHKSRILHNKSNINILDTSLNENKENLSFNIKNKKKSALHKRMTIANLQNDESLFNDREERDELRSLLINDGAGIMEDN